jgi:hypothetical protein
MPDAPDGEWLDSLLEKTNIVDDQVIKTLQGGFSIGDNTPWKFVTLNMVHGTQYKVKNPFDDPSMPVKIISVAQASGLTLRADGKPTGDMYTIQQPSIGWRPTGLPDNSVYITVQYAPPLGTAASAIFRNSALQSLANAVDTALTYDSTDARIGTGINCVGTAITLSDIGAYQVNVSFVFEAAIYTQFRVGIACTTPGFFEEWKINDAVAVAATTQSQSISHVVVTTVANSILTIKATQFNAALAARNVSNVGGDTRFQSRVSVTKILPPYLDPTTTAKVTLFFQGA